MEHLNSEVHVSSRMEALVELLVPYRSRSIFAVVLLDDSGRDLVEPIRQ